MDISGFQLRNPFRPRYLEGFHSLEHACAHLPQGSKIQAAGEPKSGSAGILWGNLVRCRVDGASSMQRALNLRALFATLVDCTCLSC